MKPALGDIYCVKREYATPVDSWQVKFKAKYKRGSIALLKATPDKEHQRDLLTFGATQNPEKFKVSDNPFPFYALTRDATRYKAEKPMVKAVMDEVLYDFSNMNKKVENVKMNPVTISNYHNLPNKVHRTLTYDNTREKSFTGSWKMGYGTEVHVTAVIPILTTNITIDVKSSVSKDWEGTDGEVTKEIKIESIKARVITKITIANVSKLG